ncbi:MAG: patatin, partial [Flavobacteriaceae bacterium]|nr:patatin [Flavobacteriaceae bacterium]
YHPFKENGAKFGVKIQGFEKSRHQVKSALHYDNSQGFGLIVNYTGRNIIGNASRFITTLDLAEQPKFRVQYQKNFGRHKSWWYSSELFGEKLEQQQYISGKIGDDLKHQYLNYDINFNKNLNSLRSFVGLGLNYDYSHLQPKVDPTINNNIYDLIYYKSNVIQMKVLFDLNTMNHPFFATSGTYIHSEFSRSLSHNIDISFYEFPELNAKGKTNNFNKFELNFEKRSSFNKKITGVFGLDTGFIFADKLENNDLPFLETGVTSVFILGGNIQRPQKHFYDFKGLNEGELSTSHYMKLDIELQYSPFKNMYLIPHFSLASVGFDAFNSYIKTAFAPKGNWHDGIEPSVLASAGATAAYNSFLGPIE